MKKIKRQSNKVHAEATVQPTIDVIIDCLEQFYHGVHWVDGVLFVKDEPQIKMAHATAGTVLEMHRQAARATKPLVEITTPSGTSTMYGDGHWNSDVVPETKLTAAKQLFKSRTGLMGATEPGQKVTKDNMRHLPPGSVVMLKDGYRLIHLHDDIWLYCGDHAHCYDRIDRLAWRLGKGATLCHIP